MRNDPTAARRMARYRARQRLQKGLRRVEVQVPPEAIPALRAFVRDLQTRSAAGGAAHAHGAERDRAPRSGPNAETINDLVKLLMHRRMAPKLKADPAFLDAARRVVDRWPEQDGVYVEDWRNLLRRPREEIVRRLVAEDDRGRRLRNSSPFATLDGLAITDADERRRLWRSAKRMLERRGTTSAPRAR